MRVPLLGLLAMIALATALPLVPAGQYPTGKQLVLDFLMVGDVDGWVNHLGDDEPAITMTLVPCRAFALAMPDADLYRLSRVYFPRTKERLSEFEVLFFNHPRLSFFTFLQQEMMVNFVATKGKVSIAYPLSHYEDVQVPWLNSPLCKAFPVDAERFYAAKTLGLPDEFPGFAGLELELGRPPVFSVFQPAGLFGAKIYEKARPAYAKEGATVWLTMTGGPANVPKAPAFISWPYGSSIAWAFGLHPGSRLKHWTEKGDWWELAFLNVCIYTMGEETLNFDELVEMRLVKSQFAFYRGLSSMFQSIVDFVSTMGANTALAERLQLEADARRAMAEAYYLSREFDLASEEMEEALEVAHRATDEATRAKERALTWIYLSEWLATAAASLVSALAVWGLMIRRRLYREVGTTQARHL